MRIGKFVQQEAVDQGSAAIRVMSWNMITVVTVVVHVLAVILSTKGSIFPATDIFLTIVGTCAQIIAGLYGITMAGYTFFLSRIDALCASDMTLDYVVGSIKKRFKYLIWFITANVLMNLVISIILMYAPMPDKEDHVFFYRLICNEFLVSTLFSIILILYYSVLVIDPNCLEKEARKMKKKLGGRLDTPGSAVEFISLYDRIEQRCDALLPENVLNQLRENKGRHFEFTIELLREQGLLSRPLIADLNRVHRYYECVVNCGQLSASQEMCGLARHILAFLEQTGNGILRHR